MMVIYPFWISCKNASLAGSVNARSGPLSIVNPFLQNVITLCTSYILKFNLCIKESTWYLDNEYTWRAPSGAAAGLTTVDFVTLSPNLNPSAYN